MSAIGTIFNYDTVTNHITNGNILLSDGSVYPVLPTNCVGTFVSGPYAEHLLSKWTMTARVTNMSSDGYLAFGLYDKIWEGHGFPNPERPTWCGVNRSTNTFYYEIFEVVGAVYSAPISPNFNYQDYTIKIVYNSGLTTIVLRDSNDLVHNYKFRYNMSGGMQMPAPSQFAFKVRAGSAIVDSIGVRSEHSNNADYIFVGDSITVGRKNNPESKRYADRIKDLFEAAGNRKSVEVWASGGMATVIHLPYLTPAIIAANPKNVVLLMGDNDSFLDAIGTVTDLSTYVGIYAKFISDLRLAGIKVWAVSMTPEGLLVPGNVYQRHDPQHVYIETQLVSDLLGTYRVNCKTINVWDTMKYNPPAATDSTGVPREICDQQYLVDYVHPNALGHTTIGSTLYAALTSTAIDSDTQTFVTAVTNAGGSLSSNEIAAVNQLVLDYKAAGLWSKYYAIYPMVGGTTVSCAINLKNPGTYNLTFFGSPTVSANGVAWNGVNQYALTGFVPSTGFTSTSSYMSYYSRTNNANPFQYEIGSGSTQAYIDNNGATGIICRYSSNRTYYMNGTYTVSVVNTDSRGYFSNSHSGSTTKGYKNGTNVVTATETVTLSSNSLALGAANGGATVFYQSTRECAFATMASDLTAAQAGVDYAIVQIFQTTLNRQV